jgi:methanogenic corrinoid protein MtbC1
MTTAAAPVPRGTPIADVARQLGVPMATLRSWEVRYNIPERVPVAGQHRRYSPDELHALRLMRDEIARGTRASLAAQSVRSLLAIAGGAAQFIEAILAASERAEPVAVRDQLSQARSALGLSACLDDVLLPAMRQVGLWWQTGRCDVEQEHLTTEAARAWLESVLAYAPEPVNQASIVLACGPTDLHTIGLEAMATLLRYRRWPCRLLGARTSTPTLTTAIRAADARAVVVVSHLNTGRKRAIQSLHAATDSGVAVFYAGNAFTSPRSRRNLPGTYLGTRLGPACDLIHTALAALSETA